MAARAVLILLSAILISANGYSGCYFEKVTLDAFKDIFLREPIQVQTAGCDALQEAAYIVARDQILPPFYKGCFTPYSRLVHLTLDSSKIEQIIPGTFDGMTSIEYINLNDNKIREIKYGVFNGLPVVEISLASNLIVEIDTRAFDDLPRLTTVNLANNKIIRWDNGWFTNTPFLSNIIFSYNLIKGLEAAAFKNVLGKYDVYGGAVPDPFAPYNHLNNYDKVPYNRFAYGQVGYDVAPYGAPVYAKPHPYTPFWHAAAGKKVAQVSKVKNIAIFLDHNNICEIDVNAFEGVQYVYKLDLAANQLTSIDNIFVNPLFIDVLNVRKNLLTCLPRAVSVETVLYEGNPFTRECVSTLPAVLDDYYLNNYYHY